MNLTKLLLSFPNLPHKVKTQFVHLFCRFSPREKEVACNYSAVHILRFYFVGQKCARLQFCEIETKMDTNLRSKFASLSYFGVCCPQRRFLLNLYARYFINWMLDLNVMTNDVTGVKFQLVSSFLLFSYIIVSSQ